MTAYETLFDIYDQVNPLENLRELVAWDTRVNMPSGAAEERTLMVKTLSNVIDEKKKAALSEELFKQAQQENLGEWDIRNFALMQTEFINQKVIPEDLKQNLRQATSEGTNLWPKAKQGNDWAAIKPILERIVKYRSEKNKLIADTQIQQTPYEVSLINYVRGYPLNELNTTLEQMADKIGPSIRSRSLETQPVLPVIDQRTQLKICERILCNLGFDFNHGNLSMSEKAFHAATDTDSRIVIRPNAANIWATISSAVHEMGHGLHRLQRPKKYLAQPVGSSGDYAMREAMAFIWQVHVARKPEFIAHVANVIREIADVTISTEELTKVAQFKSRGPIRIGSDPASFILHIVIRTKIEQALLNSELEVAEVPKRWAELYNQYLGVDVPNDAQGCLQDIHWYKGSFGYFPAYALAHLYSAVLMDKAERDLPDLNQFLAQGNGQPLIKWLEQHVYRFANLYPGRVLVEKAIGRPLDISEIIGKFNG